MEKKKNKRRGSNKTSKFDIFRGYLTSIFSGYTLARPDITFSVTRPVVVRNCALLLALVIAVGVILNPALQVPHFRNLYEIVARGLLGIEALSGASTGFFAGCLHTLCGPDHLAALAPLSIGRSRKESATLGALWGCGHDAGQLLFSVIFLLLKDRLQIEILQIWGTRVVGLTLLVIGATGIKEASILPTPYFASKTGKKKIGFATFATGVVHGLQPDALVMILPALALPSRLASSAFLGMFLVGTVVSMAGYTVFIGSCSEALKERVPRITEKLTWASSLVALGLGFGIIISQFFGFSLY